MVKNPITVEEGYALLHHWQKACRMLDWQFELVIARRNRLPSENAAGEAEIHDTRREAKISLMDPCDWDEVLPLEYDMVRTLAHEFAHVICYAWKGYAKDLSGNREREQALENIAAGLAMLVPVKNKKGVRR